MEKKLPEITLDATVFYVDVAFAELREKGVPQNLIRFFDMLDMGSHYMLHYDRDRKNIVTSFSSSAHSLKLKIPQMVDLDPVGVGMKYGLPLSRLPPKDMLLKCPQELLAKRLQNELPIIKLVNENYHIIVNTMELRAVGNIRKVIKLERKKMTPDGLKYLYYYHTGTKKVVDIPDTITELPKQIVQLAIPNEAWLDPVATAKRYSTDPMLLLDVYHFQFHLEARAFPLSQTELPKIIERNLAQGNQLKENRMEHRITKKKLRPGL
ncbi:hypothetical protein [Pedobacter nutrimenti]|uniref:hypothetical protein n=1 Tax=Pedobacter nutrimenti TaxID=1241337 RepID=UPI00292E72D3|nr:hypothetical protein [Pedobacter nutrimenti]